MKIALLDLNHVTLGVHTNTVPLGLGLISTYLRKSVNYTFDIKIFKDVEKCLGVLKYWLPDVLGLAQYAWNSELNLYIAKIVKRLNPYCLVVAGGPNLELSISRKIIFWKNILILIFAFHTMEKSLFLKLLNKFYQVNLTNK